MKKTNKNIWTIIIALLSVVLVVNMVVFIIRISAGEVYDPYSEDTMIYNISEGNYAGLVKRIKYNEGLSENSMKGMEAYQAVADYYEFLSRQKAWEAYGNEEEAEKWKSKANACVENMGEYAFAKDNIDKIFEME